MELTNKKIELANRILGARILSLGFNGEDITKISIKSANGEEHILVAQSDEIGVSSYIELDGFE